MKTQKTWKKLITPRRKEVVVGDSKQFFFLSSQGRPETSTLLISTKLDSTGDEWR